MAICLFFYRKLELVYTLHNICDDTCNRLNGVEG